jgi:hypothetical protein
MAHVEDIEVISGNKVMPDDETIDEVALSDKEVMSDNNATKIHNAYQALIKEYNSRNTPAGPQDTSEAMNNAITALEALANKMTNPPSTSGGKYRRTRRTRRTRRSRRSRKAKRSKKTRM